MEGRDTQQHNAVSSSPEAETRQVQPAPLAMQYDPYPRPAVPPLSPWTHFAVLTSVLAPVALVPYLAVRRHLISLHRKVSEVSATNAALHRDLKAALLESSIRREEHDRMTTALGEIRRELGQFRAEQGAKELERARVEERTKSELTELMAENQRIR